MDDVEVLSTIVSLLKRLDPDAQIRVLESVESFLGYEPRRQRRLPVNASANVGAGGFPGDDFSRDRTMSPKEFLRDKHPTTDVERAACLAYYLAHYRSVPHFKTIDISALNTEAAQPKFSNTSFAVENATKLGYLVSATKGNKQISALGERFVELLPDRDAAREAVRTYRPRRSRKTKIPKAE